MFDVIFSRVEVAASVLWPWIRLGGSIVGTGIAVKLMDDHLDRDADRLAGRVHGIGRLGVAAMPYALLSLLAAALLRRDVTAALFLGAYAAGMVHDWGERMPTGWPAWVESFAAAMVAVAAAGLPLAGAALCLMVFVQCVDDMVDVAEDRLSGARNMVRDLGEVETRCVAASTLLFSVSLSPSLSLAVFIAMAVIDGLFRRLDPRQSANGQKQAGGGG